MRRATSYLLKIKYVTGISIHALHEESDLEGSGQEGFRIISIHALHEESDELGAGGVAYGVISIHALHEESDRSLIHRCCQWTYFNPRSP